MVRELVIASTNKGKVLEFQAYLDPLGFHVLPLPGKLALPPETGVTLAENAFIKAASGVKGTAIACIGDDSGLFVDDLGGDPGIKSARYAGEGATDEQNRTKLLDSLSRLSGSSRRAEFRCALCYQPANPEEVPFFAYGAVAGRISMSERGENGFGYDSLFIPDEGDGRSFAEMSGDEKAKYSHRSRALVELVAILSK